MEISPSARTMEVLQAVVQTYIQTGEPVASRAIALRRHDKLSPATIRNIMADLSDLGYLDQPHTSAGRVPTAKAFRHFVRSLVASRFLEDEMERLRNHLGRVESFELRAERTSHLLTELTRNVGIAAAFPTSSLQLDQIELLLLPDRRVLMIVVTRDGAVRNQLARLEELVTEDELHSIRNYVNTHFAGWTLESIRRELGRRLEMESAAYDSLLKKLTLLYNQGLLAIGLEPAVFLEGASNLVGLDLHLTKEKLRELFRALEEKKLLVELLDQFLAEGVGKVQVQVGLEEAHPSMKDLSLIGVAVPMQGGLEAKIAVLGPLRMNYPRVMSAVANVGEALRSLHR